MLRLARFPAQSAVVFLSDGAGDRGSIRGQHPQVSVTSSGSVEVVVPENAKAGVFWSAPRDNGEVLDFSHDINEVLEARDKVTTLNADWLRGFHLFKFDSKKSFGTPYRQVGHIPVGAVARFPAGKIWPDVTLWFDRDTPSPRLEGSQIPGIYRQTFDRVVDEMIPETPVVLKLSSGLDSTFLGATLARSERIQEPIHAFTHSPHPEMPTPHSASTSHDEFPLVRRFVEHFPGRFVLHRVLPEPGDNPLDAAAAVYGAEGLPVATPANMSWIHRVSEQAEALGARGVFTGGMGNFAFSMSHRYASGYYAKRGKLLKAYRSGGMRDAGRIARQSVARLRGTSSGGLATYWRLMGVVRPENPRVVVDRDYFLLRLDPGCRPRSATGLKNLLSLDPFASSEIRNLAAAITPFEWSKGPGSRGYARLLAEGRVPDEIRLSRTKGVQSSDQWFLMHTMRERYYGELELLAQTPVLADWLDLRVLRRTLDALPWGEPGIDDLMPAIAVNRILCLGGFIRMAEKRLAELSRRLGSPTPN